LIGTSSPVESGSAIVVGTQLAIFASGLLLLIVSVGVFIGLVAESFRQQT
jgi:hypothetical protein